VKKKEAMKKLEGDQENILHRLIVWPEEFYSDWTITCHMPLVQPCRANEARRFRKDILFDVTYMH
jgi:hypothetical protein